MHHCDETQTIIITAGGTGGHVFPAFAIAEYLYRQKYRIIIVTDDRGNRFLPEISERCIYEKHLIGVANVRSGSLWGRIKAGFALMGSVRQMKKFICENKVKAVIGFGGYPAFPAMLASILCRIPLFIHEQNRILGQANFMLARFSKLIGLSFPKTKRVSAECKTLITGNPVRHDICRYSEYEYRIPAFPGEKLRILTVGGSQGAQVMGEIVPEALRRLPLEVRQNIEIIQQVRQEQIESAREIYEQAGIEADIRAFIDPIGEELAKAHLIISRSGASSIAELTLLGRPSIFVPLPTAMDDQQTINAQFLVEQDASWMFKQPDFTPENLGKLIEEIFRDISILTQKSIAMRKQSYPNAAESFGDAIIHILKGGS